VIVALAPLMDRIDLVTRAASRTRAINQLLGTAMTIDQVAADFADDDLDLLLMWKDAS